MFSLRDLRFVLCSRDLHVPAGCAKDHGLFKSSLPTNERGQKIRSHGKCGWYFTIYPFTYS